MKKTIISIMLAIVSMATFAQKEPGTLTLYPRVGMTLSKFSGSEIHELTGGEIVTHRSDFHIGHVAQVQQVSALAGA